MSVSERASAVLFVLIGWSREYLGEAVIGRQRFLQDSVEHQTSCGEVRLFERGPGGMFSCGAGDDEIHADQGDVDVVFVAREDGTGPYRAVAAFFGACWWHTAEGGYPDWRTVRSRDVLLLPVGMRPALDWPPGRSPRRWAKNGPTKTWEGLYPTYDLLCKMVGR